MTSASRLGPDLSALDAALARLGERFAAAGYAPVSPPHLFPAEVMLDVYGEDIRSRAFLFPGGAATGDELCLRPDFTVPVVLAHHASGAGGAARYAYQGPVFRRQDGETGRPVEYLQAGIENLGAADPARAEAEVLSLVLDALAGLGVSEPGLRTGDLGIIFGLLDALDMPAGRRRRLRRHIWRQHRFEELIEEAVKGPPAPTARRAALIAAVSAPDPLAQIERLAAAEGEIMGARQIEDIAERTAALAEAQAEPPMPPEQAELIEAVLNIRGPAGDALARIRLLTGEARVDIGAALDRFERRLDALNRLGLDAEVMPFAAAFGRNLEYYDGFVFECTAPARDGEADGDAPLAGGGRYDSMTPRLAASGRPLPAIGAMIRPEAALAAAASLGEDGS